MNAPNLLGRWTDGTDGESRRSREPTSRRDTEDRDVPYQPAVLLAPTAVAIAYVPLVAMFGQNLLDTGQGGVAAATAIVLLTVLVIVAAEGTAHLYNDALHADADGWAPNPWHYIVGGGLVVAAALAGRYVLLGNGLSRPLPYLAGTLVVGMVLSSVVAGPVYVYRRYRAVGDA